MATPLTYSATVLITDALEKLGVYAPGEQIPASDLNKGLSVLNDMLDQWQNEKITIYSLASQVVNLASGTPVYSIGPKGAVTDLPVGRPDKIQMGQGVASVAYGGVTYPVNVISRLEWDAIQSRQSGGGVPDTLFYDAQYPIGMLNVAPNPNADGMVLTFYKMVAFILFDTLATSAQFSQGTVDAMKFNLAVNAKSYFSDAQLNPDVSGMAQMTKEFLRTSGSRSRAFLKRSPNPVAKPSVPS